MFEAERDFVSTARAQLGVLAGARENMQWQIIHGACDIIEGKASGVRARGVALAASQGAQSARREDARACAGALTAMTQLIEQYATGLTEIDTPEAIALYQGVAPRAPQEPSLALQIDRSAQHMRGRDILNDLMPLARADESPALLKLIGLSRASHDRAASDMVAFETLMLPLTNAALSRAHQHSLRVSLSYDGPETELLQDLAPIFKEALCALTQYRIDTALSARPAALHHIALTAQQSASGLTVRYEDGGLPEQSARLDELPAIITLAGAGGWLANDGDAIILHCPNKVAAKALNMPVSDTNDLADEMMEALA